MHEQIAASWRALDKFLSDIFLLFFGSFHVASRLVSYMHNWTERISSHCIWEATANEIRQSNYVNGEIHVEKQKRQKCSNTLNQTRYYSSKHAQERWEFHCWRHRKIIMVYIDWSNWREMRAKNCIITIPLWFFTKLNLLKKTNALSAHCSGQLPNSKLLFRPINCIVDWLILLNMYMCVWECFSQVT